MTPLQLQAVQLGVSLVVLLGGGAWCVAVAWPFMRDTRRAALRSLVISEKVSLTLDEVLRAVRKVDFERVERLLAAAEKLAARPAAGTVVEMPDSEADRPTIP